MQIIHLGHSCVLVEAGGARLLLDPGTFSHGFEELTGLDGILITHQHVDHLDSERLPALLEANDGARLVAEPETATELSKVGIEAEPLHPGQRIELAGVDVHALGGQHAVIHQDISRVGNVGLLLRAEGEPTFFHPGDALDTVPGPDLVPDGIDLLGVPLNAPWAAVKETADFVRRAAPRTWFPIHDTLVSAAGRALYLRLTDGLAPDGTQLRDLAGAGPVTF